MSLPRLSLSLNDSLCLIDFVYPFTPLSLHLLTQVRAKPIYPHSAPYAECPQGMLPHDNLQARQAVPTNAVPPPWFSPSGHPLSEAPPLKEIHQGGKPIQGEQHGSLLFDVAALWVVDSTPPLSQSPQSPQSPHETASFKPFYELSFECCCLCFGGG